MTRQVVLESFGMLMAFLGIGFAYMVVRMGIQHDRYKRELDHKERMAALELGRPLPGDVPWLTPLRAGFLIGLLVPLAAFGSAAQSTQSAGYNPSVWQLAGATSIAALICGSVICAFGFSQRAETRDVVVEQNRKTEVEEDAYDVVSARG